MDEEKKNHKKFYWLKLRENFFASKEIKKLRRIAGGDTYTIIYLKLQLLSLKNNGVLMFDGLEETIQEELALEIDEDIENVKITLSYLSKTGLIEQSDDNEYTLTETIKNIGSECDSAERVRKFRELQNNKKLLCNASVTISNTEKRLELKKEIKDNIHKEDSPERNHSKKLKPMSDCKFNEYETDTNKILISIHGHITTEHFVETVNRFNRNKSDMFNDITRPEDFKRIIINIKQYLDIDNNTY